MNTAINPTKTVGELVAEREARGEVLEKLGIDFCCGGRKSLEQACKEAGITVQKALDALAALEATSFAPPSTDWTKSTMSALIDHIVSTHHVYLRQELQPLSEKVEKIAQVHGPNHPELLEVRDVFRGLRRELEEHLAKEEIDVFPACKSLELRPGAARKADVAALIGELEGEHEKVGDALHRIRALTAEYAIPADACRTYRAAMEGLARLEHDTHYHVHKENNILHGKARAAAGAK